TRRGDRVRRAARDPERRPDVRPPPRHRGGRHRRALTAPDPPRRRGAAQRRRRQDREHPRGRVPLPDRHDRRRPRDGDDLRLHHRRRRLPRWRHRARREDRRRYARQPDREAAAHRPQAADRRHRTEDRDLAPERDLLLRHRLDRRDRRTDPGGLGAPRHPRRHDGRPRTPHRAALPDRRPRRTAPHPLRDRARVPPHRGAADRSAHHHAETHAHPQEAEGMNDEVTTIAAREERARTLNLARRIGYRILPGDLFSYILHLRPREWPIVTAHTLLGTLLGVGVQPAAAGRSWGAIAFGIGLWVVALNGGTLAINSAYDDDEGDIGYLDAPPRPPRRLASFALALMAGGQLLALRLGYAFASVYALCFVMSALYSIPPFRWKAIAGA